MSRKTTPKTFITSYSWSHRILADFQDKMGIIKQFKRRRELTDLLIRQNHFARNVPFYNTNRREFNEISKWLPSWQRYEAYFSDLHTEILHARSDEHIIVNSIFCEGSCEFYTIKLNRSFIERARKIEHENFVFLPVM